jgi:hypothetical protein
MSRTPSRRVVWTLIATVLIVGGTIATSAVLEARDRRASGEFSDPSLPIEIGRDPRLASATDTDGDTLLDWEESLRGTDPERADTDGDGTSDGAEVAAGRDPKVAGPDDSVQAVASSTDAAASAEYQSNRKIGTLTDQFAESFAQEYAARKFDGGFSESDQATLISQLTGSISGRGSLATTYSADLVAAMQSEDEAALRAYADRFAAAHAEAFRSVGAIDPAKTGDAGYALAVGNSFRSLGRTICGMAAPGSIRGAHATACNANETMGAGIAALGNADDPLAALLSVPSLQAAEAARAQAYREIALYLAGRGVSLQSGSYAAFWANMSAS